MLYIRIFLIVLLSSHTLAQPTDQIKQALDAVVYDLARLKSIDEPSLGNVIDEHISPLIDYLAMSQLILGEHWKRSSVAQKRQFLQCFPRQFRHLQASALINWQPDKWTITQEAYNANQTKLALDITLHNSQEVRAFTLRLHKVENDWFIYDAAYQDHSLLKTFKDDYAEKINRLGLKRVLARLCTDYPQLIKDLTLAGLHWPPFIGQGLPGQGLSIELVSQVLIMAGYKVDIKIAPWKRVLEGMRDGEFDINIAIWHSKSREKHLLFSDPYFQNQIVSVSSQKVFLKPNSLNTLFATQGAMGIMDDYAYSPKISRYPNRQYFQNYSSLYRGLTSGELDFALLDYTVAQYYLQQNPNLGKSLQVSTNTLESKPLHISMLRKHPVAKKVLSDFNHYLKIYLKSDQYQALLNKYAVKTLPQK